MLASPPANKAPMGVELNRGNRLRILKPRPKHPLVVICVMTFGQLPLGAIAQTTEPLLPVPAPPSGPQAPAAPGQPTYAGETVTQRPRPELDPLGTHVRDFFWFPRAAVGEAYNSNIFATPSPTSDFISALQPSFDLLSSFPRNALNLHGGALNQFYATHPDQNTQDGFVAADGRLDVTAGSSLYGDARVEHLHIPRTSVNSPGNAAEPVTYNAFTAKAGYVQTGLRVGYEADIAVHGELYNAVPLIGGGTLSQSSANLTISEAAVRGTYDFLPDYRGYIRLAGYLTDYARTVPGGMRFNSTGYRTDLGLQILPKHIVNGEMYFGYFQQNYAVSSLGSIAAPDAGGRLVWNLSPLTTATFAGSRTVQTTNPTLSGTGAGYLSSVATATVDHELLRNLLVNLNAGYENDAYQGLSRTDNTFSAGAGCKYLLNRNLYLGGSYGYYQRNSTATGASYAQSILMVRFSTQF
jgi:hypothetical protein